VNATPLIAPPPPLVRAKLRPYQEEGVAWLMWIHDTGPGGLLADDMGLGKTLQTIAAMARLHAAQPTFRALVVTTTSTVYNWAKEIATFAPQLRVAIYTGPKRSKITAFAFGGGAQVVVTSYDCARFDLPLLASLPPFDWVLFDEAQALKNASSVRAQMAQTIPSKRRIVLTGTPIENGMGDFHSLFSIAVPGLLGPLVWFKQVYGGPLAAGDAEAASKLRAVCAPYMLRRLKADVAADLPQKSELERTVVLPPKHRAIYQEIKDATERACEGIGEGEKVTKEQQIAILQAITRLRQVACDPRLVEIPYNASGKLRALVEILQQAKASGQKSLVFSSFARMVHLLERDLTLLGFGVTVLTGDVDTDKRGPLVSSFERDPSKDVFLITLKAGGAGLNITAASTVVHYDPWWNPAAENQATDRAHRIGQTRAVTVHKLIAESTIEQLVVGKLGEKRALANLLLGGSGEATGQEFAHSVKDLLRLIRTPG
jgi:SNF2 family DNA or RNA helicase